MFGIRVKQRKSPHIVALSSTAYDLQLNPLKICILMLLNCIYNLLNRLIFHFAVSGHAIWSRITPSIH